jgi:protein-S-isoprenylcysteine O-methyltransferase Ste14
MYYCLAPNIRFAELFGPAARFVRWQDRCDPLFRKSARNMGGVFMDTVLRRRLPPFWLIVLACFLLYGSLSVGLTMLLGLPWRLPMPRSIGLIAGDILLVLGFCMYVWSNKSLGLKRALGKELFKSATESTLITTGAYAHTRNPIYLSVTLLFLGVFCVSCSVPIGIMTVLAFVHFMLVAKWEGKELTKRFGKEYLAYKQCVPFFIPNFGARLCKASQIGVAPQTDVGAK